MTRLLACLLALTGLLLGVAPLARALPTLPGPGTITDPDLGIVEIPPLEGATRFYEKDYDDTWIEMVIQTGTATSTLLASRSPQGPWWDLRTLPTSATTVHRDSGLTPGGFYCYKVVSAYGDPLGPMCRTLKWTRQVFENGITRAESERVLGQFDWARTNALFELDVYDRPALYYMNILLGAGQQNGIDDLRAMGAHVDELPLLTVERSGWSSDATVGWKDGQPVGRWVYAVVPAAVYNDIREASLQQIADGLEPEIQAMVFRRSPVAASRIATDEHQLRYEYLAEHEFEYNATAAVDSCPEGAVCQPILGRIFKLTVSLVVDTVQTTIEGVRQAIQYFETIARGGVNVELEFVPMNTDPSFGATPMFSAWRQQDMVVANLPVQIRQGFGLKKAETDASGLVRAHVVQGVESSICFELENEHVKFTTGWLVSKVICPDGSYEWNDHTDAPQRTEVRHTYLNAFLQMVDTAEYVETVFGHEMATTEVLVGTMANLFTSDSRPFAPCLGRSWNPTVTNIAHALNSVFSMPIEAILSVDIVMDDAVMKSRGVGVHEFGHVVMCSFLNNEAGQEGHSAWSDVIQASLLQDDDNEGRQIAEGFADYIASQVAGGTNYFTTTGALVGHEGHMSWCLDGDECLDGDYSDRSSFRARVKRYASLLHDLFDRDSVGSAAARPNDGTFWLGMADPGDSWRLAPGTTFTPAPFAHTPLDVGEPIELHPSDMGTLFRRWADRSYLLREGNFTGAMADLLRERGYTDAQICDVFQRHTAGSTCPSHVTLSLSTVQTQTIGDAIDAAIASNTPIADADADGVPDSADNCPGVDNPSQLDANGNGVGNACDADLNGDGVGGMPDLNALRLAFGSRYGEDGFDAAADLDGDGVVGNGDYIRFRELLQVSMGGEAEPAVPPLPEFDPDLARHWNDGFGLLSTSGGWDATKYPRVLADVNGDGADDVVGFGHSGVVVSLSTGDGFTPRTRWISDFGYDLGWRVGTHPRHVADVNGDGLADLVGFSNTGVHVALSTGSGFTTGETWLHEFAPSAGGWTTERHPRFVRDVNGDGRADIVGLGTSAVYVSLSTGNGFAPLEVWGTDFVYGDGWRTYAHPRMLVDVNDDGLPDLLGFSNYGPELALNDGSKFVSQPRTIANFGWIHGSWDPARHPRFLRDVNGDGLADIVGLGDFAVWVAIGNGQGFEPASVWAEDFVLGAGYTVGVHPRFVEDVDGDGLADLVAIDGSGVQVALSTGSGFAEPHRIGDGFGQAQGWFDETLSPRVLADPDGDGRPELVGFGLDGVYVGQLAR